MSNKIVQTAGRALLGEFAPEFAHFNDDVLFGENFEGKSYLAPISKEQIPIFNVTFELCCKNHWHIHHAKAGGGQLLICVGGRGYYQEWGKEPVEMTPGTVINIPADIKHWHGAADDSWFSHLAVEIPGEETSTEWCEIVAD
ncbi:Cupin domain protein [Pseudobutyrivibrio sp. YE44]|uniref:cupin domain-containing protein n=1 Tax=Pseudobutyrivibrio sp. YE44 TaxID=1520802 RepID=UPI00088554E7|nr:cupin domain-containing protein [Pseudobutyrivibrio sp. YE44]SDB03961.1 Cupin domain protein [Pseudobutyrivibrio sp. YE44]